MGYYSNDSKVSEHLEGVSDMMHTGYQAILWCFAFTRAVWLIKITLTCQKHELYTVQILEKSVKNWASNHSLKIWSKNTAKCGTAKSHEKYSNISI